MNHGMLYYAVNARRQALLAEAETEPLWVPHQRHCAFAASCSRT